jgi:hypothetical protein
VQVRNVFSESLNFTQATFRLYDAFGSECQRVQALESSPPSFIEPGGKATIGLAYDVPGTQRQFRLDFYLPSSFTAQVSWDITS